MCHGVCLREECQPTFKRDSVGWKDCVGEVGPLAAGDPAPRRGLKDTHLNLSEWVLLPMQDASCEGVLSFERILRASWELGCLSGRIREDKAPDLMGTQT